MTTPTPLAETIARAEAFIDRTLNPGGAANDWLIEDIRALLACARRCEAMDRLCSSDLDQARDWIDLPMFPAPRGLFKALLDAASERDALAKRAGELEGGDFMAYTNELVAESARLREENDALRGRVDARYAEVRELRTENERLAKLTEEHFAAYQGAHDRASAAQDRVTALEQQIPGHDLYVCSTCDGSGYSAMPCRECDRQKEGE